MKLRMPEMPPSTLLTALGSYNLLPAIVFLPTRRRCDEAASEAALSRRGLTDNKREARRDFMLSLVESNPEIRNHRHWDTIVRGGVASHHAGHMPAWKLVIEKMMSAGLLDAIFATATVAAGVDFPARSVVITAADRRGNRGWESLTASQIHQLEKQIEENRNRIRAALAQSSINLPIETVLALERLAAARSRLLEGTPQTRRELRQRWLNKVVQPGRVVAIGRSGRRLALA